jgi:hypothetical protein
MTKLQDDIIHNKDNNHSSVQTLEQKGMSNDDEKECEENKSNKPVRNMIDTVHVDIADLGVHLDRRLHYQQKHKYKQI